MIAAASTLAVEDIKAPTLGIRRLHPNAKIPTRGSKGAAGYDLYSIEDITVEIDSEQGTRIKTGLSMSLPSGVYGRVAPDQD